VPIYSPHTPVFNTEGARPGRTLLYLIVRRNIWAQQSDEKVLGRMLMQLTSHPWIRPHTKVNVLPSAARSPPDARQLAVRTALPLI